jgi:salicylate hydroxylase
VSGVRNAKPVVIAGGGIGGLACALALAVKGFHALVLEQQEFGEIGAGIQLAPNAWSALDALGVGEDVKQEAVFIERLLMMDGVSGETVIDIPLDARFRERYGNPYAVTHRADIHRCLLDACKARADLLELRTHSKVTGFDLGDEGVSVKLGGGDRIAAAALVGADGWRSAVRARIVGDGEPPVSGHMCYRAVLSIDDMPKDLRWAAATLWAGPNTHIVHYPLRGWKLFNLVATVVRERAGTGHNEEAPPEEVLPLFARNCDTPLALLRVPRAFRRWMLRFREPVENWSRGPVTLLGDAAHLMLQYFAQGAAMAMEDAIALAAAADAADGDFAAAFQRYQTLRLVRASRVQISSRMLGLLYHADGVSRLVRNDIYCGRPAERYYDALDWIFSAPDYVQRFR